MVGSLQLITAPAEPVVTLEEAKAQLRVTTATNDDMISALIAAAVQQLDPAGGGWLGRALRPQTWELRLDGFPNGYCGEGYSRNFRRFSDIELPYPPLIEMVSVKYDDANNVEHQLTLDTDYRVFTDGTKSVLRPVYGGAWPTSVRRDVESVRVRYTSGYPTASTAAPDDSLPAPIKQAVLLMLRHLWALGERNLFISRVSLAGSGDVSYSLGGGAEAAIDSAVQALLSSYRVWA